MFEQFITFISRHESVLSVVFQALASFSALVAAFFSFRSIRQVTRLNKSQAEIQKRESTVNFIANSQHNIGELSRVAFLEILKIQSYRNKNADAITEHFGLDNYNISAATKARIIEKICSRIPLSYTHGIPVDLVESINKELLSNYFSIPSDAHRAIANLFNRFEEISNAINVGILDVDLFDKMYGGLLFNAYTDHSDWLVLIKRKLGFRFYDQFDVLFNTIFLKATTFHNPKALKLLFKLLICGKPGRRFLLKTLQNWRSIPNQISHKQLVQQLNYSDLAKYAVRLAKHSLVRSTYYRIFTKPLKGRKHTDKISELFLDSVIQSYEVWPVGVKADLDNVKLWVENVSRDWDYSIAASIRKGGKEAYIGFIGVSHSKTVVQNQSRWSEEILASIRKYIKSDKEQLEYLNAIGLPYIKEQGVVKVDFRKMAMIKSLYVRQDYRTGDNLDPIGRKLLRKAITYCRDEVQSIPFLTVLADESYTEKAIALYVCEGGTFIGTCRDANRKDGHLMHVFVF